MKKIIQLILLILVIPSIGYGENIEKKGQALQKLMVSFEKVCLGKNQEILDNVVVVDREGIIEDGKAINCGDEARRLAKMINALKLEVETASEATGIDGSKCIGGEPGQNILASDNGVSGVLSVLKHSDDSLQCKPQSSVQCVKDLSCNVFRATGFSAILNLVNKVKQSSELAECAGVKNGSCLTEVLTGVIKDLWTNLEAVWDIAKLGAKGVKKLAISSWDKLTGVEDRTADAAMAASQQSNSSLALFKNNPLKFMKGLIASVWDSAGLAIKKNFGCEKWDGAPHLSNCIKEMSSWDCANCDQRLNAICGVVGVMGGEVIAAFITGGTLSATKLAAKGGIAGFAKIGEAITKVVPVASKISAPFAATSKVVRHAGLKSIQLGNKLLQSEIAIKILAFSKTSVMPAINLTSKVATSNAMKITFKVVEGVTSPITGYMQLLEKSFTAGFSKVDSLSGASEATLTKFSDYFSGVKTVKPTQDITIVLSGKLSREEILLKLKEKKIPYEEVSLGDGKKGIRIKLDPSCKTSGLII